MRKIAALALAFTLALAAPVYAAITLSQNGTANGNVPSVTGKNTTGDTLFTACVVADNSNGTGQSVTDNKGNTWTRIVRVPSLASNQIELWYSLPTTVGASTNFTYSGNFAAIDVLTFQGTATSSVLDGSETHTSGSFSTTSNPGSITPSQNNGLFVTCLGVDGGFAGVLIDSSFTVSNNVSYSGNTIAAGYFIQTTAAAKNPQWSNWTSQTSYSAMQVFKDPGGAPPASTVPLRGLMGVGQ